MCRDEVERATSKSERLEQEMANMKGRSLEMEELQDYVYLTDARVHAAVDDLVGRKFGNLLAFEDLSELPS